MAITDEQSKYYIQNVCTLCNNYDTCNKDRFIKVEIADKSSIKCIGYDYKFKVNV